MFPEYKHKSKLSTGEINFTEENNPQWHHHCLINSKHVSWQNGQIFIQVHKSIITSPELGVDARD
jgi:hypothetical protein